MARSRVRAAAVKAARALEQRQLSKADEIGIGVGQVAREIQAHVLPGALWWQAPLMYLAEQMAAKAIVARGLPADARDDIEAYLLAALQEMMHSLFGSFDWEHVQAWTAAREAGESG